MLYLVVVSPIRKEKKRKRNNDLAVLPSHDIDGLLLSNRWADRKDKPEVGTVSEGLY